MTNPTYQIGQTAVNPKTGEKLVYTEKGWLSPDEIQTTQKGTMQQAVKNLVPSTIQLGKDVAQPFIHPIKTGESLLNLGSSILGKMGVTDADPSTANAVGQYLVDRYGGLEALKNTFAKDPAGIIADVSMLLTAGGSAGARLPGVAGKIASKTAAVGRAVDPLSAALSTAKKATTVGLGFTSGAGERAIEETAKAGYKSGKTGEAFQQQLRSTAPVSDVVNEAKIGLNNLRQQRSQAYRSGMVNIKNDRTILDFNDIDQAVSDVKNRGYYKGQPTDVKAADAWGDIDQAISEWKNLDPAEYHTPEGIDALKRRIGGIKDSLPFGSPARNAANNVYNAIRQRITAQAPTYAKVMKEYEEGSDLLSDLEHSLSLGDKARADTSVRKLQSILRNNANTNYGRRAELGEQLTQAGAENLMPMLAGQALSSNLPRGLSGTIAAGGAGVGGLAAASPMMLAALPLTSPRLVGEGVYYAGKAAGVPSRLAQALAQNPATAGAADVLTRTGRAATSYPARMLALQLSRLQGQ